jgi:hypothetical protein
MARQGMPAARLIARKIVALRRVSRRSALALALLV